MSKPRRAATPRRMILLGVGGVIGLFLLIQLLPVWLLQTNPPVVAQPTWDSPQTAALVRRTCYDCHSNETTWPWYSRVAPISWLVTIDVLRGRDHINFSEWGVARAGGEGGREGRGGNEYARVIQNGDMPPTQYLILHPNATLSETEKQQLIQGLQASLK